VLGVYGRSRRDYGDWCVSRAAGQPLYLVAHPSGIETRVSKPYVQLH
jgi:hypothetical protein